MGRVTLYLDETTEEVMRQRAAALGLPYSQWVAQLIREHAQATWPVEVARILGAFPDMPLAGDPHADNASDLPHGPS